MDADNERALNLDGIDFTGRERAEREPDPWFNPYRSPVSHRAHHALGQIVYETEKTNRKRKRKVKDRDWFWEVGLTLLADLAYHFLNGSPGTGLVVVRAKSQLGKEDSRYHPPYFTRTFPKLLDDFESAGYLTQEKGESIPFQRKRTTVRAGANLIAVIEKEGLTFDDFDIRADEEVIILKRRKRYHSDRGAAVEYEDTPLTERLREEVRDINAWLNAADINFDPSAHSGPVDVRARRLFRYFAGDFKSGGRLFRGFWENLPPGARLHGLEIDGERVVELDYAQLNPMLAYAKVGYSPPAGDAYALPGLGEHRDGVKKVFNALLFDKRPRKSFPKGVSVLFPPKTKIRDVIAAIHDKHPLLISVLSTGAGFGLMFVESEIMMAVLMELRSREIVGLPVHDAVIVKASEREATTAVMKEQFRKRTGSEIEVRAKEASRAKAA